MLANRLTEDPAVSVLLLEAGGWDRDPLIHVPLGWGRILARQGRRRLLLHQCQGLCARHAGQLRQLVLWIQSLAVSPLQFLLGVNLALPAGGAR